MLYLDTEFNGFGGQLLSIALTSDNGEHEFYAVLPTPAVVHPWVAENVIPLLGQEPEPYEVARHRLAAFLRQHAHNGETIVADWPDDFMYLLSCLREDSGISFNLELDLRLIRSGDLTPAMPHNALSDARALKYWMVANEAAA